jgi:Mg/Co/Ni transporter MgtE
MPKKTVVNWMRNHTLEDVELLSEQETEVGRIAKDILQEIETISQEV